MAILPTSTLKELFQSGRKPTGAHYGHLIDTLNNTTNTITQQTMSIIASAASTTVVIEPQTAVYIISATYPTSAYISFDTSNIDSSYVGTWECFFVVPSTSTIIIPDTSAVNVGGSDLTTSTNGEIIYSVWRSFTINNSQLFYNVWLKQ